MIGGSRLESRQEGDSHESDQILSASLSMSLAAAEDRAAKAEQQRDDAAAQAAALQNKLIAVSQMAREQQRALESMREARLLADGTEMVSGATAQAARERLVSAESNALMLARELEAASIQQGPFDFPKLKEEAEVEARRQYPSAKLDEKARLEGFCFERDWHVTELKAAVREGERNSGVQAVTKATVFAEASDEAPGGDATLRSHFPEGCCIAEEPTSFAQSGQHSTQRDEGEQQEAEGERRGGEDGLRRQAKQAKHQEEEGEQQEEETMRHQAETKALRRLECGSDLKGRSGEQVALHDEGLMERQGQGHAQQLLRQHGAQLCQTDSASNDVHVALQSCLTEEVQRGCRLENSKFDSKRSAEARPAPRHQQHEVAEGYTDVLRRQLAGAEVPPGPIPSVAAEAEGRIFRN